jgi:2-polyprenyl-3-methyl-5-hydroxy-6-metoxy-1,4-benzoquinol methylase
VKDRDAREWEELARREPYFAILTSDGNPAAAEAYLETGESDIVGLLAAITTMIGREIRLDRVLDFGCGAGRLTLPLARRSRHVVACDIAPTMLAHTRQNAERAGLHNVEFMGSDELAQESSGQFDFICSLLVLEHVSPDAGYEVIRLLSTQLASCGIAALHVPPEYRERLVVRSVEAGGAQVIGKFPMQQGGALIVAEKP